MGWTIQGKLSTDTRSTDFTTLRIGKPRVTAADPLKARAGVVHPPEPGDLMLDAPPQIVRARRINTGRAIAGYDYVTVGGRPPTRRTFRCFVQPSAAFAPIDISQLDQLRYFWETAQRVRLREDHWEIAANGDLSHSMRDHGDQIFGDLIVTPEDGQMGVPIGVSFTFHLTALTAADVTA